MNKTNVQSSSKMHTAGWRIRYLRAFGKDEDGSVIILTILLLITMLVLGGMAVDFMRYEARRATLQSVADRAVLASASLGQTLDSGAVVEDYFAKAGFADAIVGTPVVVDNGNSRTVSVRSQIDLNTFYLRLIGMDTLTAPAASSATEGVGKVEISLVLDISGSMRYDSKFTNMQAAAIEFANEVLDPANGGTVSLTIIPYAGATNPGPEMFDFLGGQSYVTYTFDEEEGPFDEDGDPIALDENGDPIDDDVFLFPRVSSCLEVEGTDWSSSGLPAYGRSQVPHFQVWAIAADVMDWGWCPQDNSAIRYAMSTPLEAETFINGLRMHDGTGTHYAMKYALATLDPASQPAFAHLAQPTIGLVPSQFANRPAPWDDHETKKIIVLMTDGAITQQMRPKFPLAERNLTNTIGTAANGTHSTEISNAGTNVNRFEAICALANDATRNVDVYTVAFQAGATAENQMRGCATDPSMYFRTSGAELIEVFAGIAQRITDLRLNL